MELWDFFNQQGVAQLCLVTLGAAVLLVIMVWWMWYRRAARAKKQRAELSPQPAAEPQLPPPPEPPRKRSGVWGAIVNFFMEPPKTEDKAEAERTDAPDSASTPDLEPAAFDAAPVMQTAAEEIAEMDQSTSQPAQSAAETEPGAPLAEDAAQPHAEEPAPPTPESALGPIVSFGGGVSPAQPPRTEGSIPLPAQPPAGVSGPSSTPRDAVEVMRVWRDLADGSLIVDFGGQRCRSLIEVEDPDLRRRFLALLRSLNQMAGLESTNADKLPAAVPPPTDAVGLHDAINRMRKEEGSQEQPHMLRQLGRVLSGQTTGPAGAKSSSVGIVGQIEDFLQYKLQHTVDFTGRSIHIRQSVSGVGVSIEVDGHFYEGVGDVADADVREFLQETIQEWQNRQ